MSAEKSKNFFQNLLDSLFGGNSLEAEKKRKLKNISKSLSKSRYKNFYRFSGNEALPALAKNIYEIYKVIYPAQTMFHSITNPNLYKRLILDYCLPKEIRELEDSLSTENIMALSKKIPISNLKKEALSRLSDFSDYFTLEKINEIDELYKQFIAMKDFCTFDFYYFLKKFHKSLREADFSTTPQFEKINADYILDDIKDFIAVAWAIPLDSDYSNLTKLLRAYKSVEPITLPNWRKIMARLTNLKQSGIFEMMIKLISSNPGEVVEIPNIKENVVEPYIETLKKETQKTLDKLVEDEKTAKASDICSQLFNDVELVQLNFYTDELNSTFKRKGLETFLHSKPLKYLKSFLIEIFKKDFKEYYDLVFIRGHWESQVLSKPFSEAYNSLLAISEQITKFDNQLAEDSPTGMKINSLLQKTDRDNGAKNIINRLIDEANESAYGFIIEGSKNLIVMGKIIKSLIEDLSKPKHVLISNWAELEHYTDIPVREFSVKIYQKIYLITTLIKTCLVQQESESEVE